MRAAVAEQVKLALDKGFTADEVDNAKRALLEERRVDARAGRGGRRRAGRAGVPRTHLGVPADLDRAIGAVSVDGANAALRKYLKPADLATFIAGDFAKK